MGWTDRTTARTRTVVVLLLTLCATFALSAGRARAAAAPYTTKMLSFTVHVGPAPQETCTIVGELFTPAGASAQHPDPAILTTNGFGGSYSDQVPLAETFASRGYVVLTYSGLGFGGSGCKIELDSPLWDGEAASQLITFLGGGSAADDGTRVDDVLHDAVAHDGVHYADDPRVGMIGGSYGGEIQFAAADVDPRLDAIIPVITWNNLAYSLAPNNALSGDAISETSGVAKFEWIDAFSGVGVADGISGISSDPSRDTGTCPNFDPRACSAMAELNSTGTGNAQTLGFAEQASVESYMDHIHIPTMLMQGEDDTLFNLHEAVATYDALRAQHTPVKLVFQSWGHSNSTPVNGEWADNALNRDGSWTVEGQLVDEWFNHYLKDAAAAPVLDFSYYEPWVGHSGATAVDDYASAPQYPLPAQQSLYLTGTNGLTDSASGVAAGQANIAIPPAGAPTSTSEISAVSQTIPLNDTPGTFAEYETAPLTRTEDVVGIPKVTLQIKDSLEDLDGSLDPSGGLALFFKLEDIAPDGTVTLPDRLVSPARFDDLQSPVTVTLPGIVQRFRAPDRIALIVAAGDSAYRANTQPSTVQISTDPSAPGVLTLPIATPGATTPLAFAKLPRAVTPKGVGRVKTGSHGKKRSKRHTSRGHTSKRHGTKRARHPTR